MLRYVAAITALLPLAACGGSEEALDPAAVEAGRQVFATCTVCHSASRGEGNKIGPNLYGVAGSAAAAVPGYEYSAALKDSGIVWDDAALDAYLADPLNAVPGGKMIYAGMPDPADRAAVITYLKSKR